MFKKYSKLTAELTNELVREIDGYQHKLGKVTIDQTYKAYYIMGVVGGIRIALRTIDRLRKRV